jgi:zinc transporter
MSDGKHNLYLFKKEGGVEKIHFKPDRLTENYWLNLQHPSKTSRQLLKPLLPKSIYESLFAKEDRPRNLILSEGIFLSLRGINMSPGEEPDDMVFLRLWLTPKGLITIEHSPVQAVRDLHNTLHIEPTGKYDGEGCFVSLVEQLLSHIEEENYDLDSRLDDIEDIMGKHNIDDAREKLVDMRQRVINFRRYLLPQREALYKLAYEKPELLDGKYNGALKDANQDMLRHLEALDAARDRATVLQDNLTNMFSERLNEKIYVLSIVAMIFMPTMLITSLLGINVHIPGSDHGYAFWIVCILLIFIMSSLFIFLKRKRWI